MELKENTAVENLVEILRKKPWGIDALAIAQSVVYDTVGGNHPIMAILDNSRKSDNNYDIRRAISSVVTLYDQGMLRSPRLAIAHEIEVDILDIAQGQVEASGRSADKTQKQLQLAIAAFLAGAALEDALRRLCDAHGIGYNPQRTTISNLQAALYQPSKQISVISGSENKQITAWGETRNNADHGRFGDITHTEVLTMVMGVRGFIDKHLP